MSEDDRKLTYSERDRQRREGGGAPQGARARAEEEQRSRLAKSAAESLFVRDGVDEEGKSLAAAVRAAHGTAELPAACRSFFDQLGVPEDLELLSIFLDAGEKDLAVAVLDAMLKRKESGSFEIEGSLKRQLRILSEDFDDDLASRAEELLE